MAPTGPPNQSSTPPNTELKVQQISQPGTMNIVSNLTFIILTSECVRISSIWYHYKRLNASHSNKIRLERMDARRG